MSAKDGRTDAIVENNLVHFGQEVFSMVHFPLSQRDVKVPVAMISTRKASELQKSLFPEYREPLTLFPYRIGKRNRMREAQPAYVVCN